VTARWRQFRSVVEERLWSKVDVRGPDECWPWRLAVRTETYGQLRMPVGWGSPRVITGPKLALMLKLNRELKPGHVVCHTCDWPPCCNPAHLIEGTQSDNMKMRTPEKAGAGGRAHRGRPKNHGEKQRIAQFTLRMRACSCGMRTNAGSMAHHLRKETAHHVVG